MLRAFLFIDHSDNLVDQWNTAANNFNYVNIFERSLPTTIEIN